MGVDNNKENFSKGKLEGDASQCPVKGVSDGSFSALFGYGRAWQLQQEKMKEIEAAQQQYDQANPNGKREEQGQGQRKA